jgi:membrane protease subunit HflC
MGFLMKKYILILVLVATAITFARLSFYTVDASEYVYVTVLGKHNVTYDGANQQDGAGLKFGWPWPIQQTQRLDRRLQHFDLPATEQLTHEGNTIDKILLLEAYVCWKISDELAVDRFVRRIGTAGRAREILAPQINGRLGAAIGQMRMDDLVNATTIDPVLGTTKVDATLDHLRQQLLNELKKQVLDEYGIELVDVRLRRFNHPGSVRDSIFARIRSERNKEATRYLSDGDRKASDIASKTDQEVREKLAEARAQEEKLKADADIKAMKIRNDAYSQDPEFYRFVKTMEKFQSILGSEKTMLLLSTYRPMFESMFKEPRLKTESGPPKDKKGGS